MPVGANQMNLYLFELGMLTRVPEVEAEVAVTLALHPLLTAPNSIRYTDPTRSTVTQTVGGAIDTRGGRGLQTISMGRSGSRHSGRRSSAWETQSPRPTSRPQSAAVACSVPTSRPQGYWKPSRGLTRAQTPFS